MNPHPKNLISNLKLIVSKASISSFFRKEPPQKSAAVCARIPGCTKHNIIIITAWCYCWLPFVWCVFYRVFIDLPDFSAQTKVFKKKTSRLHLIHTLHVLFYISYGRNSVRGEGTCVGWAPMGFAGARDTWERPSSAYRLGWAPIDFAVMATPTNLSMIIIRSYLILSDTHVLDCLKVLLNK